MQLHFQSSFSEYLGHVQFQGRGSKIKVVMATKSGSVKLKNYWPEIDMA